MSINAATLTKSASRLTYRTSVVLVAAALFLAAPAFWYLEAHHGVDKKVASNLFSMAFVAAYSAFLFLPWLRLSGTEQFDKAGRMERMVITWLVLTVAPHLLWELPWLIFYDAIMEGKGQLWAYSWWAYMDGGDMRYVTRDIHLVLMEIGASIVGAIGLIVLLQRRARGTFSSTHLRIIMALMIADFYPTYMYYATEIAQGLPNVDGLVNFIVKFVLANCFWLFMPWIVFIWAGRQLVERSAVSTGASIGG